MLHKAPDVNQWKDGEIFKPGEVWESPKGLLYTVEEITPSCQVKLRLSAHPGQGRIKWKNWDAVANWTRIGTISEYNELYA